MSYQSPQVVHIEFNAARTMANCEVRFVDVPPPTSSAGHRSITVTAFIPLDPGDPVDVISARAISVARVAIADAAAQAP